MLKREQHERSGVRRLWWAMAFAVLLGAGLAQPALANDTVTIYVTDEHEPSSQNEFGRAPVRTPNE